MVINIDSSKQLRARLQLQPTPRCVGFASLELEEAIGCGLRLARPLGAGSASSDPEAAGSASPDPKAAGSASPGL